VKPHRNTHVSRLKSVTLQQQPQEKGYNIFEKENGPALDE